MKKQIVIIHGGDTYNSHKEYIQSLKSEKPDREDLYPKNERKWKDTLGEKLGGQYEIFAPEMPNWLNAKYEEWKIKFDKIFKFLEEGPIFVGHSLGAIFLAKYFAENSDKKKAKAVFLVATPYSTAKSKMKLADFMLPKDMKKLQKIQGKIHLYHSKDDPWVKFKDNFEPYRNILPEAKFRIFEDKQHFLVDELPEIVADIQTLGD